MPRDNFSKNTITILAERVGYHCSNPECGLATVGPNADKDKSTRVGEAAHITAASVGGPRYDSSLTPKQRKDIDNAVWLCSNCSDLIDKDETNYPSPLLKVWKANAENEQYKRIKGVFATKSKNSQSKPFLEANLQYNGSSRRNMSYSEKNPVEIDENGNSFMVIGFSVTPIIHWHLNWDYSLFIYNNSSYPAFNIKVEQVNGSKINIISKLPKINNLEQLGKLDLSLEYSMEFEGIHIEADEILKPYLPSELDGLELLITYLDEERNEHKTIMTIEGQEIINSKV